MLAKTKLFFNKKFNFKKNFTIHKVGDSKDLEIILKRYPLIRQLPPNNFLAKEFDKYIEFITKNKGSNINDYNGNYLNFTDEDFIDYCLTVDEIKYLRFKYLSKNQFMRRFNK